MMGNLCEIALSNSGPGVKKGQNNHFRVCLLTTTSFRRTLLYLLSVDLARNSHRVPNCRGHEYLSRPHVFFENRLPRSGNMKHISRNGCCEILAFPVDIMFPPPSAPDGDTLCIPSFFHQFICIDQL